jgi:hypothetical protein
VTVPDAKRIKFSAKKVLLRLNDVIRQAACVRACVRATEHVAYEQASNVAALELADIKE